MIFFFLNCNNDIFDFIFMSVNKKKKSEIINEEAFRKGIYDERGKK